MPNGDGGTEKERPGEAREAFSELVEATVSSLIPSTLFSFQLLYLYKNSRAIDRKNARVSKELIQKKHTKYIYTQGKRKVVADTTGRKRRTFGVLNTEMISRHTEYCC